MAGKYRGQVTFVSENFGASKLAERFGVKGYPAVFVDDVLVASPRDFGYFGEVEGTGRYAPWRKADGQEPWSTNFDLYLVQADGQGNATNLTAANKAWEARFPGEQRQRCYCGKTREFGY